MKVGTTDFRNGKEPWFKPFTLQLRTQRLERRGCFLGYVVRRPGGESRGSPPPCPLDFSGVRLPICQWQMCLRFGLLAERIEEEDPKELGETSSVFC